MQTAFDTTRPRPSGAELDGGYVRSTIDWTARCSKRLVALNPGLGAEKALNLAHELAGNDVLRARSPELVAEDMESF